MTGLRISKTMGLGALVATLITVAPSAAQQPPQQPAPPYVLSVQGLYPNVAEAGSRRIAMMVAYGLDPIGNMMRRLAIVDVTPGGAPRGIQRVFEPGRAKVKIGSGTYDLAINEFFNAERNRGDLEITLTLLETFVGVEQPTAVVKTSLSDLLEVRARQAREANVKVQFGSETFWVTPGFFANQSGFLFFDDAAIQRLGDPVRDPGAFEPRFVVMTTERRGVFDERLADSVPIGATGYIVAWDRARLAWVAKRAGQ